MNYAKKGNVARGRRTVTSWIRAAGLSTQFRSCYIAVAAAGKTVDKISTQLLRTVITPLVKHSQRLTLALDDTPTQRLVPTSKELASITTRRRGQLDRIMFMDMCSSILGSSSRLRHRE